MRPVARKIRTVLSHEGNHHLLIKKARLLQRELTNEWRALRGTQLVSLPPPPPASRNAWRSPRPLPLPDRAPHNWGAPARVSCPHRPGDPCDDTDQLRARYLLQKF